MLFIKKLYIYLSKQIRVMPKVRVIINTEAGREIHYTKGNGIPVDEWKKVFEHMQLSSNMLGSMINAINKK